MGSGKRFRIGWMNYPAISLGVTFALRSEHEVSVHVELIKIRIYIGFGKGYEEFSK